MSILGGLIRRLMMCEEGMKNFIAIYLFVACDDVVVLQVLVSPLYSRCWLKVLKRNQTSRVQ